MARFAAASYPAALVTLLALQRQIHLALQVRGVVPLQRFAVPLLSNLFEQPGIVFEVNLIPAHYYQHHAGHEYAKDRDDDANRQIKPK